MYANLSTVSGFSLHQMNNQQQDIVISLVPEQKMQHIAGQEKLVG